MKIRTLESKALSMCLVVAIIATYSMVALAGNNKIVGEILVSGNTVSVNGENVKSGRTIFTSSTISTPENTTAIVNVSKIGKVKIAPNSTLLVSFDENGISGNLLNGKVTVLSTNNTVDITTPNGGVEKLSVGKSATTVKQDDDDDDDGGSAWVIWAVVFGGAAAALIIAAQSNNNRVDLGGGSVVVSPNR